MQEGRKYCACGKEKERKLKRPASPREEKKKKTKGKRFGGKIMIRKR